MKSIKALPAAERIRELLSYDPMTGQLYWKVAASRRVKAGDPAGHVKSSGYVSVKIDGSEYYAHRLIWKFLHGTDPGAVIDHLDGNRQRNTPWNLADVPVRVNCRRQFSEKRSLPRGVTQRASGRYRAQGRFNGKVETLGYFDTAEAAALAYQQEADRLNDVKPH